MTDIALDDLIQKDKQQKKGARIHRNKPLQRRGGGHIPNNPRGAPQQRGNIRHPDRGNVRRPGRGNAHSNRFNSRAQFRQNESNPVIKHKPIQKNIQRAERPVPPIPQEKQDDRTLKVMGLHPDFTNEDLYKLFASQGAMEKCLIEQDNFGRSLTTAVVKYHNASSATNAIKNLNQHKVMNSILTVEPYRFKRR